MRAERALDDEVIALRAECVDQSLDHPAREFMRVEDGIVVLPAPGCFFVSHITASTFSHGDEKPLTLTLEVFII